MLRAAVLSGALKPGGLVVEGTSGSTGISLAYLCRASGYKLIVVSSWLLVDAALPAYLPTTDSDANKLLLSYFQFIFNCNIVFSVYPAR